MYAVQKPGTNRVQLSSSSLNRLAIDGSKFAVIANTLAQGKQVYITPQGSIASRDVRQSKLCSTGCITKAKLLRQRAIMTKSLTRSTKVIGEYNAFISQLDAIVDALNANAQADFAWPDAPWEG